MEAGAAISLSFLCVCLFTAMCVHHSYQRMTIFWNSFVFLFFAVVGCLVEALHHNNVLWSVCSSGSGYPYVLQAPAQDFYSGKTNRVMCPNQYAHPAPKLVLQWSHKAAATASPPSLIHTKWMLSGCFTVMLQNRLWLRRALMLSSYKNNTLSRVRAHVLPLTLLSVFHIHQHIHVICTHR